MVLQRLERKSFPVSKVITNVQSRSSGSPIRVHAPRIVRPSLDRFSSVSRPFLDRTLDRTLDQSEVLRNACSLASAAAAFRALTPSLLSPAEGRDEGGSVA